MSKRQPNQAMPLKVKDESRQWKVSITVSKARLVKLLNEEGLAMRITRIEHAKAKKEEDEDSQDFEGPDFPVAVSQFGKEMLE